jgi:selenium metabolism protein YedF
MGCDVTVEAALEGTFSVIVERPPLAAGETPDLDASPVCCEPEKKLVVLFSQDTFGTGDAELGRALLLAFAATLPKLTPKPTTLVFLNSGAKLVCEETPFVEHVRSLEATGTRVLVCGTCLDFYNLEKQLKIGDVSNMMEIAGTLAEADKIIRP